MNSKQFEVNKPKPISMAHLSVKMKQIEQQDTLKFICKSNEEAIGMTLSEWKDYLISLNGQLLLKQGRLDAYTTTSNYKTDRILAEIKRVNKHINYLSNQ